MAAGKRVLNLILNLSTKGAKAASKAVNHVKKTINSVNKTTSQYGRSTRSLSQASERLGVSQNKIKQVADGVNVSFARGKAHIGGMESATDNLSGNIVKTSNAFGVMNDRLLESSNYQSLYTGILSKGQQQFKKVGKQASNYGQTMQQVEAGQAVARKGGMGFRGVMALNMNQFKATQASSEAYGSKLGALTGKFRMAMHGAKGFRMEMLSLMFGGMQLQKTMMGLLKPALKTAGVFKIFGMMLKVLFLPVALTLLKVLLPVANWFMNLPGPVKKAIGAIVLIGAIVGTMIMIIGQATLALGGMAIAFGAILGPILIIIAIITAVVLIILYWDEIVKFFADTWSNLPGWLKGPLTAIWNAIKTYFLGMWNILKGFIDFVVAIFTGDWEGAAKALGKIWKGIKQMFFGLWKGILNFFIILPAKFYAAAINLGIQLIKGLISGIKQLAGMVADAIWSIIPEPFKGLLKGAANIAGGLVGGIGEAISGAVPFLQGGGKIKESGLAVVHAGESVIPEGAGGGNNINITINMDNEVSSDIDITRMADRLESELARRLRGKNL